MSLPKSTTGADARYLAFDLGAESSRAIVGTFGEDRLELEELHRFPTRNVVVQGTRFWDVLFLFSEFKEALRQYAIKYGPGLAGIGVDTWGVDFALLGENGQLLGNPVHYRDHRTDGILDDAFEVVPRDRLYAETGIQFMPINTLFQVWAMHRTAPQILREARTFLMMPDLLNYFLTGVICSEYTIASTSQMLDVRRREWSRSLLEAFSIPVGIMPEILEPTTVLGPLEEAVARDAGLGYAGDSAMHA